MTLIEFERQVIAVALASNICGVPVVRRLTATSINLRIGLTIGGFVDAFCNEQTGTNAFALIQDERRIFGADNTGDWHVHPFDDPTLHLPFEGEMPFAEFIAAIERRFGH